jgi:NAD-dependent SIR2 family protein deacetylase
LTDSASTLIDTNRIGFFVGAGASMEFGIPSMKKMTTTFAAKLYERECIFLKSYLKARC